MADTENAIGGLVEQVHGVKDLLLRLRSTPETYVLVQAVGRHLLFAHETGSALVVALRKDLVLGTPPLLRNLLEGVVEMLLFVTWPSGPKEAAARSMAWDLLEWKKRRENLHEKVSIAPRALPGVAPAETRSVDAIFEDHVRGILEMGGDPAAFQQAWKDFRRRRPNHWSGRQSFAQRARLTREQYPEEERIRLLSHRYEFLWSEGSYASHATPRWNVVKFKVLKNGSLEPRAEQSRSEQVVAQAENGAEFLGNLLTLTKVLPLQLSD